MLMGSHNDSFKVLHILEHGISLTSGYGFRSQKIFQAQVKRGWQPVVLTFPAPSERDKGHSKQPQKIREIKYYYRPLSAPRGLFPLLKLRRDTGALAKRIYEVVAIEKPDLLHGHSPVFNGIA